MSSIKFAIESRSLPGTTFKIKIVMDSERANNHPEVRSQCVELSIEKKKKSVNVLKSVFYSHWAKLSTSMRFNQHKVLL